MAEETVRQNEHRPRLGRGLAALLGDDHGVPVSADQAQAIRKAPIEFLRPNPRNPRKAFAEGDLEELTASIRARGVIQPILVRVASGESGYEIVAGERRWRAAQRAEQHEVPIVVVEANDREALEIAIVENVQRTDLNALEEANGYAQLAAQHGYSQSDIARVVGKSRSHIANTLRLANLPEHTRALLSAGEISAGHARALLAVTDPDLLVDRIVAQGLTVRDIERLGANSGKSARRLASPVADPDTRAVEDNLSLTLGAKVTIRHLGDSGEIRIGFRSFEQLDDFCRRLAKPLSR
jgi:ParB family chromosome partitioning protein